MSVLFKRLAQTLAAALVVLVLFLAWASQSNSGLTWLLRQMPTSIQAEGARGALGDFRFDVLRIELPEGQIVLRDGQVQWNIFDLLTKTIAVSRFNAQRVEVALNATQPSTLPPSKTLWRGIDLPINLIVREATLANVRVQQANQTLGEFKTIALRADVQRNRLRLEQFRVSKAPMRHALAPSGALSSGPQYFELTGAIDLTASPRGRVELEYGGAWQGSEQMFAGNGTLAGTWQTLRLQHRATSPLAAQFSASIDGLLSEQINWDATFSSASASFIELGRQAGLVRAAQLVDTELTALGSYVPIKGLSSLTTQLKGEVALVSDALERWDAELDVGLAEGALTIRTLELTHAPKQEISSSTKSGRVQVAGKIVDVLALLDESFLTNPRGVELNGEWSNLRWPFVGLFLANSADASAPMQESELNLNGRFALSGSAGDYRLNMDSAGVWSGNRYSAAAQLSGPIEAVRIDTLVLTIGDATLNAQGRIADTVDVNVAVAVPQLSVLQAAARGDLDAQLRFSGEREHVQMNAIVTGSAVQWQDYSAQDLRLSVRSPSAELANVFSLSKTQLSTMAVELNGSVGRVRARSNQLAQTASVNISGSLAEHAITLNLDLPHGTSAALTAQAGIAQDAWSATVSAFDINGRRDAKWQLNERLTVKARKDFLSMPRACIASESQRICVELDLNEAQQMVAADVTDFELHNLQRFFQLYDLDAQGRASGALRYTRLGDEPGRFTANLISEGAELSWQDLASEEPANETLVIESMRFTAVQNNTLEVSAKVSLDGGGEADFNATIGAPLASADFAQASLLGQGTFNLSDLSQLPPSILSDISLTGELFGSVNLAGKMDAPSVSLSADVRRGSARVANLGLYLQEIELQARSNDSAQIDLKGSLMSGTGKLQLNGELRLPAATSPSLALRITGEELQMVNTTEMQIMGGVALNAIVDASLISLSGDVTIESAELDFKVPELAVQPSNDVVLEGVGPTQAAVQRKLDVRVDLGQQTRIQAQGLDARLVGQLRVLQQPNGIMRGEGQITIRKGRYIAYGQDLDIDSGVLIFDGGSIDDPNLELKAQRVVDEATVGVRVTGRAQAPRLALFSSPTMPDQDILAVLIFKKPVDSLTSNDALTLLRIANSVTGEGPDQVSKLTQRLEETFGLTELEINLADGAPGLIARKQLTSRFSVAYGYGLLDAAQSLFLRYRLSDRWSIKADLGADSGADLRYQIER